MPPACRATSPASLAWRAGADRETSSGHRWKNSRGGAPRRDEAHLPVEPADSGACTATSIGIAATSARIIRSRPVFCTALACMRAIQRAGIPAFHPDVALAGGDSIRCARRRPPDRPAAVERCLAALRIDRPACSPAGGLLVTAPTLQAAAALSAEIEALAQIYCQVLQLDGQCRRRAGARGAVIDVLLQPGATPSGRLVRHLPRRRRAARPRLPGRRRRERGGGRPHRRPRAIRSTASTPASASSPACASMPATCSRCSGTSCCRMLPASASRCRGRSTRLMMALKLASLAQGASGVRPPTLDLLQAMLARDVVPVVPSQGSVGASGDLAPLAHMTAAMIGVGEAFLQGRRLPALQALAAGRARAGRARAEGGPGAAQRHAVLDRLSRWRRCSTRRCCSARPW